LKRIASLGACVLALVLVVFARPLSSSASPLRDVPSNHWALDYIQTLAADGIVQGYPNGKFDGSRDMSRYEMAAIVARAVAYVQANGASASDVEKLQKLMDAYKDELDGLGVRVSTVEDKLSSLDRATQFAQRFNVHGLLQSQYSERERTTTPMLVDGVTLAYKDPVFKFTDAFIETDASNDPYYGSNSPAVYLPRMQWDFTPQYAVTPNVVVSLPIHIIDFSYGGVRQQQVGYGINPTLDVTLPDINGLKGGALKIGQLTNLGGSLTGLAYSPPDNLTVAFKDPYRPFPMGVDLGGTAYNWLDFQAFGYRVDPVLVNTGAFGPNTGINESNSYLGPYYPQQSTNVYSSSPTTDTFPNSAVSTTLITNVYLSALADPGTIFISYLLGPGCPAGCTYTGPGQGQPAYSYVQSVNEIIFSSPLPAGSQVAFTYKGYTVSNNTLPQRYDVGGRAVYRVPGIGNGAATLGLTFNRLFDVPSDSILNASYPGSPNVALVSNTVFGLDAVMPLAYAIGPVKTPALFGEVATSKYTADYQHVPAQSDTAGVIGLKFKILGGDQTIIFQNVGPNYIDGAPFQYSGQAPAIFSFWNFPFVPGPYGIGNDLALTAQVDRLAAAAGFSGPFLSGNTSFPYGSFAFPLFNQFKAAGPYYYSTFTPNTTGESVQLNFPLTLGNVDAKLNIGGQELHEIRPNSLAVDIFGPQFASTTKGKYDQLGGGLTLGIPLWDRKATVTLNGLLEKLERNDKTPFVYAADPVLGVAAYNPVASAELTGTGSQVLFYPNFVNVQHTIGRAQLALPVTAALSANLDYIEQRYTGEALNTLSQSISERKLSLTGGVLYNIPNTNASVNLFFNRYEYHDDNASTYDWVQNRQNLYFTVKF
jgi:S-layer homology domain